MDDPSCPIPPMVESAQITSIRGFIESRLDEAPPMPKLCIYHEEGEMVKEEKSEV